MHHNNTRLRILGEFARFGMVTLCMLCMNAHAFDIQSQNRMGLERTAYLARSPTKTYTHIMLHLYKNKDHNHRCTGRVVGCLVSWFWWSHHCPQFPFCMSAVRRIVRSRQRLHEAPALRLQARVAALCRYSALLHVSRVQACVHLGVLQEAAVAQLPLLVLGVVADAHHHRGALGKLDGRQAQVKMLDLAALRYRPFLVAAGVVTLVGACGCDCSMQMHEKSIQVPLICSHLPTVPSTKWPRVSMQNEPCRSVPTACDSGTVSSG